MARIRVCLVLFILLFSVNLSGSITIPEYAMNDGVAGSCGTTVTIENSVLVKSHLGAGLVSAVSKYDSDQNCNIVFTVGEGKFL